MNFYFQAINLLDNELTPESKSEVTTVVQTIVSTGPGSVSAQSMLEDYENRFNDTKERCKKVRGVVMYVIGTKCRKNGKSQSLSKCFPLDI